MSVICTTTHTRRRKQVSGWAFHCFVCEREIEVGQRYSRTFYSDGGRVDSCNVHENCVRVYHGLQRIGVMRKFDDEWYALSEGGTCRGLVRAARADGDDDLARRIYWAMRGRVNGG